MQLTALYSADKAIPTPAMAGHLLLHIHILYSGGYKPGDYESRMDGRARAEAGPPSIEVIFISKLWLITTHVV